MLGQILIAFVGITPVVFYLFLSKVRNLHKQILEVFIKDSYVLLIVLFVYFHSSVDNGGSLNLIIIIPLTISIFLLPNKLLPVISINMSLLLLSFLKNFDIVLLFVSFEFIFLVILIQPLLIGSSKIGYIKLDFLLNILKWNLPSTVFGVYIIFYSSTTFFTTNLPLILSLGTVRFVHLLLIYILLKISI